MAGIVALKQNAWDAASAPQKAVARLLFNGLTLGTPASGTLGGVAWYVWSDRRIDSTFVENLSWVMARLPSFTDSPVRDYPTTETILVEYPERVRVEKIYVDPETGEESTYFVWEETGETLTREEEVPLGDPLTLASDANIEASWFTARQDLPAGWVPDSGEGV